MTGSVGRGTAAGVRRTSKLLAPALALGAALAPAEAGAEPSTWCAVSGGAHVWQNPGSSEFVYGGAINADVGLGTSPEAPFVVGGLGRLTGYIGAASEDPTVKDRTGADLALLVRGAMGSFARGGFGLAAEAGGYARFWGVHPSAGFTGGLTLGAPLGFSLTLQAQYGPAFDGAGDHLGFGATFGIDFARLLVHREVLQDRWPNYRPARRASGGLASFSF